MGEGTNTPVAVCGSDCARDLMMLCVDLRVSPSKAGPPLRDRSHKHGPDGKPGTRPVHRLGQKGDHPGPQKDQGLEY